MSDDFQTAREGLEARHGDGAEALDRIEAALAASQAREEELRTALDRCERRVKALERGIARFLEAEDAGEMGNRDAAIAHLRNLMERI